MEQIIIFIASIGHKENLLVIFGKFLVVLKRLNRMPIQ